jgi:dihydroorotate dehydrogenase
MEEGGLSGKPLRERSTEVIRLIAEHTNYTMPIIGGGGVFSAQDAIEKLEAGAWILQIYTSFVYEGPMVVGAILRGLLDDMENKQMTSLSQYTPGGNQ